MARNRVLKENRPVPSRVHMRMAFVGNILLVHSICLDTFAII